MCHCQSQTICGTCVENVFNTATLAKPLLAYCMPFVQQRFHDARMAERWMAGATIQQQFMCELHMQSCIDVLDAHLE